MTVSAFHRTAPKEKADEKAKGGANVNVKAEDLKDEELEEELK